MKQLGQRNQKDDLPQNRNENTAFPFVDSLEVNRKHHRKAGGKKADGYDPQSRCSNVQNGVLPAKIENNSFGKAIKMNVPNAITPQEIRIEYRSVSFTRCCHAPRN